MTPNQAVVTPSSRRIGAGPVWVAVGGAFAAGVLAAYVLGGIIAAALVVVGTALVIGTIVRPQIAVLAAAALVYSNAAALAVTFNGAPPVVAGVVPLLLLAPSIHDLLLRKRPLIISSVLPLMLAYLVVQLVSAFFATDRRDATEYVITFVLEGVAVFALVTNAVRDVRTLHLTIWALVLTGAFLGAISGLQQATDTFYTSYFGFARLGDGVVPFVTSDGSQILRPRLAGPLGESNYYAQYLLMLVPLGIALAGLERRRSTRVIALACTALIGLGIALAASRGAALGLLIVIALLVLLRLIRPMKLLIFGTAAIIALTLVSPGYITRLVRLEDVASGTDEADRAVVGRVGENRAAILAFSDHPVLGVGPGQFKNHYQDYARQLGADIHEGQRVAHSLYLSTAAEVGVLGFVAFFAIITATMWPLLLARLRSYRPNGDTPISRFAGSFFVSLVAFLGTGVFLDLAFARYFWLMVALAAVAGRLAVATPDTAMSLRADRKPRVLTAPASG